MRTSKHIQCIGIAVLALGVCATLALAQNEGTPPRNDALGGGPPPSHHRPILPIIQALDVNHDGIIDSNEIANASAELLTLDKNHDGRLTPDEYMPPRPDGAPAGSSSPGHQRPIPLIVRALDANHDGIIDAKEIANAPAALLTLDKNHDGQLTRDEYMDPRPNRAHDSPEGGPQANSPHPPPVPPAATTPPTPPTQN